MSPPSPSHLCAEAIRLLGDVLDKPPAELKAEVDVVERAIVALRDALIDRRRQTPTDTVRSGLDHVNVALSLVVGQEYPMGGVDRDLLKQARSALEAARNEAFP